VAKYLYHANYGPAGAQALLKEGGTARRAAVEKAAASLGGSVESFYYAFGHTDAYVVVDLPTNEAAASFALNVGATGVVSVTTTVLLEPEQIDAASRLSPDYRAPGG
jgi:uncharacterized protein with GYD domain